MEENLSHKAKILIADPFLLGPVFERAVIYLTDHTEEGAMGFILNQPTDVTVNQAVETLENCKFPVYYGGPVDDNILFYIHTRGDKISQSVEIEEGIFWGGNFNELHDLILNNEVTENEVKFFVGYAGWSEKQLEEELENKTWLVGNFKPKFLFQPQNKDLWNRCLKQTDSDLSLFGKFAHTPSLN